jgi:hypothetical protein
MLSSANLRMAKLFGEMSPPVWRALVQDDPELHLAVAEPALPFLAQLDELAGLLCCAVAERDDRGGVLLGLQQSWNELLLVDPHGLGRLFHAHVRAEPVRE